LFPRELRLQHRVRIRSTAAIPCLPDSPSIIAVTGLGGRAFGSFKAKGSSHMWLRDSLGSDLPGARILTYGFDSHVKNSDSFQGILSLADQFKDSLRTIRNYEHVSTVP